MRGPILVVAPHPDDEAIGVGGTILRARSAGIPVHWLIATAIDAADGWPAEKVAKREAEIAEVAGRFGFAGVHRLGFPSTRLGEVPTRDFVGAFAKVVQSVEPQAVFLPHHGDAHSDHHVVWEAGAATAKPFRYPSVEWVLVYETLSETDQGLKPHEPFQPTIFVDIAAHLEAKIEAALVYADEFGAFPFPRSAEAMRALAAVRGVAAGFRAAEAFMLLRGRF